MPVTKTATVTIDAEAIVYGYYDVMEIDGDFDSFHPGDLTGKDIADVKKEDGDIVVTLNLYFADE